MFIICYPRGDQTKLSVAEICEGMEYEKSDYRLASRRDFHDRDIAVKYAKELARDNGLTYEGEPGEHNFLD